MREIKFRAWYKPEKKMYRYVEYSTYPDGSSGITMIGDGIDLFGPDDVDVEIMQFTGLKDKNGKEVYEGDILKCFSGFPYDHFTAVVVAWEITEIQDDISATPLQVSGFVIAALGEVEVIGNIYEHPELLK